MKIIPLGRGTRNRIYYTNSPSVIGGIICRDASGGGGQKLWYHFDRLGNVMGVTNSNGNVVTLYTMEAFGNVLQITNGPDFSNTTTSDYQPYHLTTKEYDADVGLYYFNARWYDPTTGRFVSRDPVQLWGEVVGRPQAYEAPLHNEYAFVRNNPLWFADPTGAQTIDPVPPDDANDLCACDDVRNRMERHTEGDARRTRCLRRCWAKCGTDCHKSQRCPVGKWMADCMRGCEHAEECGEALANLNLCIFQNA